MEFEKNRVVRASVSFTASDGHVITTPHHVKSLLLRTVDAGSTEEFTGQYSHGPFVKLEITHWSLAPQGHVLLEGEGLVGISSKHSCHRCGPKAPGEGVEALPPATRWAIFPLAGGLPWSLGATVTDTDFRGVLHSAPEPSGTVPSVDTFWKLQR